MALGVHADAYRTFSDQAMEMKIAEMMITMVLPAEETELVVETLATTMFLKETNPAMEIS